MAISTSSSFIFTSPNFTFGSKSSSQSISSVKYRRAYSTTAERSTATDTDTVRSLRNTCSSSLYEVLGVRIGADTQEVKAAYRRLARVLHPDVVGTESSADEFIKLHSAYSTLSDPEKRANYDRTLFRRRAPAASGFRSRRWETDQCW